MNNGNQKIKKSAGRLSPTPMGDYDDTTTYRRLDWVYYGGTTYICKKIIHLELNQVIRKDGKKLLMKLVI